MGYRSPVMGAGRGAGSSAPAGFAKEHSGDDVPTAVERAAAVFCNRWKPALLYVLARGEQRYNALARQLPGVTPKMLTQQLRALERDGLVARVVRSRRPRHVEYSLTTAGEGLRPVVDALAQWARWLEEHAEQTKRESMSLAALPNPASRNALPPARSTQWSRP